MKKCRICLLTHPLTAEYWHARPSARDGFCNMCKSCACARTRQWGRDNNVRARQAARDYAALHREEASRRARKWYAEHKERALASIAANRKKNPLVFKERLAAYRRKNTERVAAWKRNYKLRKRGAEGSHTGEDIKQMFCVQNGCCNICGVALQKYHVDHVMPLILGGSNYPENLQLLCAPCNLAKHAKHPDDFARRVSLPSI